MGWKATAKWEFKAAKELGYLTTSISQIKSAGKKMLTIIVSNRGAFEI
ncbi:MAG: hypothetical protein ACI8P9_003303 [Parasphingorhabdus sp.]|jgi:hypothetical protein